MAATIILGDPHLGKHTTIGTGGIGSALNSRIVDQFNILDWVLEQAIEKLATNIIITGDVFEDPRGTPTLIAMFVSWLKKCTDNNIGIHIIMGNHDHLRSGQFYTSVLDIIVAADLENVSVYKDIGTLDLDGVSFTLLPFRDRRSFNTNSNTEALDILRGKLPYELASIELNNLKVLVGHLALEGSLFVGDEIDDMQNELFCPLDMFRGYDYVWMGHIHKPQVMKKMPYLAHIGSMDISDFGEMDHKKKIIVFDPKKEKYFEYIDIPTRPLRHIMIDVPTNVIDGTGFILEKIKTEKDVAKSIVKLSINFDNPEAMNVNRTDIEKCIYDMGAFHIFRIIEERKISLVKKLSSVENIDNTVNEMTAINMFAEANVEKEIRGEFIGLAQSIVKEFSEGTK